MSIKGRSRVKRGKRFDVGIDGELAVVLSQLLAFRKLSILSLYLQVVPGTCSMGMGSVHNAGRWLLYNAGSVCMASCTAGVHSECSSSEARVSLSRLRLHLNKFGIQVATLCTECTLGNCNCRPEEPTGPWAGLGCRYDTRRLPPW